MPAPRLLRTSPARTPRLLGTFAFLAVLLTLDHPGITIDEPLDVRPGRTYVETLLARGPGFFRPEVVDKVFRDNAEHPPLGRWLLGVASKVGEPFEVMLAGGPDPLGLYVRSGRLAPALCFGLLVWVVAREAGRRSGHAAAWGAGLGLIAMPRVFAHAHLGALDLMITFFWVKAFLAADRAVGSEGSPRSAAVAGVAWGLALLTKIHAWLLPPLVLLRAATNPSKKAGAVRLLIWGAAGATVFVVGWPWLWYDLVGRLAGYLGTGVDRTPIRVLYFGQVYEDRAVPWHFPWVHFAATVPLGLQLLGGYGAWRAWADRREDASGLRTLGAIVYLLAIFSTGVAVYDGERLYLMAFPLWALLIGRGFGDLWGRFAAEGPRAALGRRSLAGLLALQLWGLVSIHPYWLSYYNLAVGGLAGAERLGLEVTYWTDAVDARLLNGLANLARPNDPAALAPTLAPNQGKLQTTRAMARKPVILEDQEAVVRSRWVVVHRREAYFTPEVRAAVARGDFVQVSSRQGVWLAALIRAPKSGDAP